MDPFDLLIPGGHPIGVAGSSPEIREVQGSAADAQQPFDDLTAGGSDITPANHPGTLKRLPGGGTVGVRFASKSGAPTIDVNIPGINIEWVKYLP